MTKSKKPETPLMQQFGSIKAQYPDALLLFRVGDFYETFGEDAIKASRILGITLTKRNNGGQNIELAGFPHHSLDNYLPKLVRAGFRVAICDQLEDPKATKTIVKRGVTEVVTPGVVLGDVVDQRSNNWLAAVCGSDGRYGAAFLDITTGEFLVAEEDAEEIARLLHRHAPTELLLPKETQERILSDLGGQWNTFLLDGWVFTDEFAREGLLRHFSTISLKGFGVEELTHGQHAAGAVLHYLSETKHDRLAHVDRLGRIRPDHFVGMDRFTTRNLELVAPVNEGAKTLLQATDRCTTPMGSRALKRWILFPLSEVKAIEQRSDKVEALLGSESLVEALGDELGPIGDLERLVAKAAAGRINPREVRQIHVSLDAAVRIKALFAGSKGLLETSSDAISVPENLSKRISDTIEEDTPVNPAKGGVIKPGVIAELDELRHISSHAKELLLDVQRRETDRTGITSLKVGFNNVFGYYLEVRNVHKAKVPPEWVRKQTLVGAERYITDELKGLEEKILSAEERTQALELECLGDLVQEVVAHIGALRTLSVVLAEWDVIRSFACTARAWNYCKPLVDEGFKLHIEAGRHPVIEQQLPPGAAYVANDVLLDPEAGQLTMITGPNMSGKSALLRQTALIVLLAQIGSYVPAASARIGRVDRIFTRVGASDNLTTGESTFMVEMNETASILNNLTDRSLVLLDEIGRGTSTYDGISIAWAITEFLHDHAGRPKTLFATHYHELNEMASTFPRVRNANVAVREANGKILFLRKLVPGGSDRSFGIHVAQLAGMPSAVLQRARKVLAHLEASHAGDLGEAPSANGPVKAVKPETSKIEREMQMSFFQLDDPALESIRQRIEDLDIDTLTPVEALMKLNDIKRMVTPRKQMSKA